VSILIFFLVSYILLSISLYMLFPKAGVPAVKGLIPGVNFMEWCTIIGKPKWFALLLLIPIVGFFIFAEMCTRMVRSFDKLKLSDSAASIIYPPAKFMLMAKDPKTKYVGPIVEREAVYLQKIQDAKDANKSREYKKLTENNPFRKSAGREWVESIFFAVFAAAFIRMFLIEAYVIPTPSMEGSLLVGDFLFVSKAHYGIRTPMTIAMIPLLHNRVPFFGGESYFEKPSLPYFRLKALEGIDNNDPIVFNWPVGDSVYLTNKRSYTVDQVERDKASYLAYDKQLRNLVKKKEIITRPLDKKDHYIKRCLAIGGDSLEIRDRQVYVNGKPLETSENVQYQHFVKFSKTTNINKIFQKLDLYAKDAFTRPNGNNEVGLFLSQKQVDQIKSIDPGAEVNIVPQDARAGGGRLFPHDEKNYPGWTVDNFGPVWIPAKGSTTPLNMKNLSMYRRAITVYEHNELDVKGNQIYINGEKADSYTFKQDYYWAMGDNRHNSEDSRAWGYVPHDHIVGKPLFIWFSTKNGSIGNGIRWNRLFKSADVF